MEFEDIMKLFDSCWFEMEIFKEQHISPSPSTPSISKSGFEANPGRKSEESSAEPELTRTQTHHTRSMSDQLSLINSISFIDSDDHSFSPDSVLHSPKQLHKIISGKEFTEEESLQESNILVEEAVPNNNKGSGSIRRSITRRKKGSSKSLSDLEFEELKGFMDLGFVFSEEDNKDSRLVEIIPALQRLGKKDQLQGEEKENKEASPVEKAHEVSRPYLSEAWESSERRRGKEKLNPLMNWKVPDLGNEIDMKDSLKWWAHTVASTVR